MKNSKTKAREKDELLPEYDFSRSVPNRYAGKLTKDSPVYIVSSQSAARRKPAAPANGRHSSAARKRARKGD